jgi:hypothetical protein
LRLRYCFRRHPAHELALDNLFIVPAVPFVQMTIVTFARQDRGWSCLLKVELQAGAVTTLPSEINALAQGQEVAVLRTFQGFLLPVPGNFPTRYSAVGFARFDNGERFKTWVSWTHSDSVGCKESLSHWLTCNTGTSRIRASCVCERPFSKRLRRIWSPRVFGLKGKAFLGLRFREMCLRDARIDRCPKANSRIPLGEGEAISASV